MTQTLVQQGTEAAFTGISGTCAITGTTAGNAEMVYALNETNGTAFNTPTSSNTWSTPQQTGNSATGVGLVSSAQNIAGGSDTITISYGGGSQSTKCRAIEVSGSKTTAQPDAGDHLIGASGTTHDASSTGINPSGACFILVCSSTSNTLTSPAAGGAYTRITTASNFGFIQYGIFTSAPVNEKGEWTTSNLISTGSGMMALAAAAGGSTPKNFPPFNVRVK